VWKVETIPVAMDQLEICAEKIRAVSQRARYRDFYDLYYLLKELDINLDEALGLLRKKEIRKPVIASSIPTNWAIAKEQMARDLGSIYVSEEVPYQAIEDLVQRIQFSDIEKNT